MIITKKLVIQWVVSRLSELKKKKSQIRVQGQESTSESQRRMSHVSPSTEERVLDLEAVGRFRARLGRCRPYPITDILQALLGDGGNSWLYTMIC